MSLADLLGYANIPPVGDVHGSSGAGQSSPQLTPQQRAQYLQLVNSLNGVNGFGSPSTASSAVGPGAAGPSAPRRCDVSMVQGGGGTSAQSDSAVNGGNFQQVPPHFDLAQSLGMQVEQMILSAKCDSETKVCHGVMKIRAKLEAMAQKVRIATARVARLEDTKRAMSKAELLRSLASSEDVWDQEVGMLKHEFWQMVQAHNHNADLMKHHKDVINDMQDHLDERFENPELDAILKHLIRIENYLTQEQETHRLQVREISWRLDRLQSHIHVLCGGGFPAGPAAGSEAPRLPAQLRTHAAEAPLPHTSPAFF